MFNTTRTEYLSIQVRAERPPGLPGPQPYVPLSDGVVSHRTNPHCGPAGHASWQSKRVGRTEYVGSVQVLLAQTYNLARSSGRQSVRIEGAVSYRQNIRRTKRCAGCSCGSPEGRRGRMLCIGSPGFFEILAGGIPGAYPPRTLQYLPRKPAGHPIPWQPDSSRPSIAFPQHHRDGPKQGQSVSAVFTFTVVHLLADCSALASWFGEPVSCLLARLSGSTSHRFCLVLFFLFFIFQIFDRITQRFRLHH